MIGVLVIGVFVIGVLVIGVLVIGVAVCVVGGVCVVIKQLLFVNIFDTRDWFIVE